MKTSTRDQLCVLIFCAHGCISMTYMAVGSEHTSELREASTLTSLNPPQSHVNPSSSGSNPVPYHKVSLTAFSLHIILAQNGMSIHYDILMTKYVQDQKGAEAVLKGALGWP